MLGLRGCLALVALAASVSCSGSSSDAAGGPAPAADAGVTIHLGPPPWTNASTAIYVGGNSEFPRAGWSFLADRDALTNAQLGAVGRLRTRYDNVGSRAPHTRTFFVSTINNTLGTDYTASEDDIDLVPTARDQMTGGPVAMSTLAPFLAAQPCMDAADTTGCITSPGVRATASCKAKMIDDTACRVGFFAGPSASDTSIALTVNHPVTQGIGIPWESQDPSPDFAAIHVLRLDGTILASAQYRPRQGELRGGLAVSATFSAPGEFRIVIDYRPKGPCGPAPPSSRTCDPVESHLIIAPVPPSGSCPMALVPCP